MRSRLEANDFDSYAVAVGINGHELLLTSPNVDEDTYFEIASMGKVLVTTPLILNAVGRGEISLEDTLSRFYADVPEDKRSITLRHMLTHTSGIIDNVMPVNVATGGGDAIVAYNLNRPLAFAPGSAVRYGSPAFRMLGFIVEKVYGATLDEAFYAGLQRQLGLTRSRFNIALQEPNAAHSYRRREPGYSMVDDPHVYCMGGVSGAGSSFWTVADVQRYVQAVFSRSEALYPHEYFESAETDHTPGYSEGRGLGWLIVDDRYPQTGHLFPADSFGHTGHTGTSLFMNRERNLYTLVLTNATRHLHIKSGFSGKYDYRLIEAMRREIHDAIADDLTEQELLGSTR